MSDGFVIRAYGTPIGQGSLRTFTSKAGRTFVTSDSKKMKPWRQDVADLAREAGARIRLGAVHVLITFYLPRPTAKRRNKRLIVHPDVKPDIDKLARAILDALTRIAWKDDGQVTDLSIRKTYETSEEPIGARIAVDYLEAT